MSILIIMTKLTSQSPCPPLEAGARGRSGHTRGCQRRSRSCSGGRWCSPPGASPRPGSSSTPHRLHTPACKRIFKCFSTILVLSFCAPTELETFRFMQFKLFSNSLNNIFNVLKGRQEKCLFTCEAGPDPCSAGSRRRGPGPRPPSPGGPPWWSRETNTRRNSPAVINKVKLTQSPGRHIRDTRDPDTIRIQDNV